MRAPLAEVKIVLFSGLLSISEQECRQRCYQDFLLPLPARGQKIHSKNGHLIIYPKHFSVIPTLQVLLDVSMPFFFADDVTSLAVHSSTVVFYFENWIV